MPSRISTQTNGSFKVEWTPVMAGKIKKKKKKIFSKTIYDTVTFHFILPKFILDYFFLNGG